MTLFLPEGLPCLSQLRQEGLSVAEVAAPGAASGSALRIGILNLMPDKIATEVQLIRMLAHETHDVAVVLFATSAYMDRVRQPDYKSTNTPVDHLRRFYRSFEEVRDFDFDGLIITGAPVEQVPFEEVPYWSEMEQILDWIGQRQLGVFSI